MHTTSFPMAPGSPFPIHLNPVREKYFDFYYETNLSNQACCGIHPCPGFELGAYFRERSTSCLSAVL